MIGHQEVEDRYTELADARRWLYEALTRHANAKYDLEDRETELVLSGQIVGKNEREREALLHSLTTNERETLRQTDRQVKWAELVFRNTRRAVEAMKVMATLASLDNGSDITNK